MFKNFWNLEPIRLAYFFLVAAQALYAGLGQGFNGNRLFEFVVGALVTVLAGELARSQYTPLAKRDEPPPADPGG